MKSYVLSIGALLAATAGVSIAVAQAPAAPPAAPAAAAPAAPAKPTVESLMAAAKAAGGAEFGNVVMATCIAPTPAAAPVATAAVPVPAAPTTPAAAPPPPARDTWYAPPAKVADNFYFIGTKNHSAWALVATNGDMIIIDNLFDYAAPDEIIGGLKRLGLDPNKAKFNIISHAHGDHDGGAKYIQDTIPGIKIIYGAGDWPAVEARTNPAQKVRKDPDSEGTDGRVITVGDVSVRLVAMPGHTPGTTSMLFEVKDGGQVKKVAYNGGTLFSFTQNAQFYDQYIASSQKFGKAAADFGATWLITNHSQYDNAWLKAHTAMNRKPGDPSPFDLGVARVATYFVALQSCAQAAKVRSTGSI
jgi:metallo-beta-lactamase class B